MNLLEFSKYRNSTGVSRNCRIEGVRERGRGEVAGGEEGEDLGGACCGVL